MGSGRGVFAGGRGGSRSPIWEAVDRSQQPCVFFSQGKCTKGDLCQFSHASAVESGSNRATDSSSASPRTDTPEERVQARAEQHSARTQTTLNSGTPQTSGDGREGTNALRIGKTDSAGQVLDVARPPAERRSRPSSPTERLGGPPSPAERRSGPSSQRDSAVGGVPSTMAPPLVVGGDGNTYVIGPDGPVLLEAVMRTMAAAKGESIATSSATHKETNVEPKQHMTKSHDRSYQARGAASSRLPEKAPTQSGVIALPDGGFMTRKKRAAELQLLRDDRGEKNSRLVRQRNVREQEKVQERRPGTSENRGAPTGGRVSIMDRLGPAKQAQGRQTTTQRPVGPSARSWSVAPDHPITRKQETRQHGAPVDRSKNNVQTSASSVLSRAQALGTARSTRWVEGGKGDIAFSGKGLVARPTVQRKAAVLDFKIPTLGEIKSKKAKAEGTGAAATTKPEGRVAVKPNTYNGFSATQGNNGDTVTPKTSSPTVSKDVHDTEGALSLEPAVQPVLPKLDAADMDEFSEWL